MKWPGKSERRLRSPSFSRKKNFLSSIPHPFSLTLSAWRGPPMRREERQGELPCGPPMRQDTTIYPRRRRWEQPQDMETPRICTRSPRTPWSEAAGKTAAVALTAGLISQGSQVLQFLISQPGSSNLVKQFSSRESYDGKQA
jgi:hypothetical protein